MNLQVFLLIFSLALLCALRWSHHGPAPSKAATKVRVLLLDMVDNSTSPLQPHFWLVFGDEAVQTGLLFPE